jgi:hypothetical protein
LFYRVFRRLPQNIVVPQTLGDSDQLATKVATKSNSSDDPFTRANKTAVKLLSWLRVGAA